jgi:pre-mRNA cleavage complex 2 protein Pcf11
LAQRGISIDSLKDDIQRLTAAFTAQIAQNPLDPVIQTKLKALMDLQTILQTQNLPQDQLVLVKNQIADLAVNMRAPQAQTSAPVAPPNPVAVAPPPAVAPKVSLDSLFGSGALAAIMARNSSTPQVPTPQPPQPPVVPVPIRSPPPQKVEPQKPVPAPTDPMALLSMLRQAGMLLPPTPATAAASVPSRTAPATLPFPLPQGINKNSQPAAPGTIESLTSDIMLKASSLKQYVSRIIYHSRIDELIVE